MSQQRPAEPRGTAALFRLQRHLRLAVLALCLVAVGYVFASSAAAFVTACPKVSRPTITAATGLPHTAVLPEVQNDDSSDCFLLLWRGHRPAPGKPSKAAEKAGRLARLTVSSENLHEPYSEAHDNGFTNHVGLNKASMETLYTPFTVPTFGAEAAFAGTRKVSPVII
jgi:hypothetical protein